MAQTQTGRSDDHALVDLRNVIKAYNTGAGDMTVLQGISLQVRRGEFVSIVGPSGSGKSTMLNMITGIDRPTQGEVYVAGQALHTLGENELALWRGGNVGIIFQFFQLLPTLTIVENVILPMGFQAQRPIGRRGLARRVRSRRERTRRQRARRERRLRAMSLLELVGIADQADKLPNALSGGQQQRAAIARALANDPPVLVGDEPTGNLDSATAEQVFGLFEDLVAQGKTVICVTHDRALSRRTGRVLHLLDGRLHRDENNDLSRAAGVRRLDETGIARKAKAFDGRRLAQSPA